MRSKRTNGRNGGQLALPFGSIDVPVERLRLVYERSRLKLPFESALALPHLRICLRNVVLASSRRRAR